MTGNTEKYSENKMDDKVDAGLKRPGKDQGKNPMKALGRLIRYILKEYKLACITVVVSILISALAILSISMFMQKLIDVYIEPMMKQSSPDYGPLAHRMLGLGLILVLGIICAYAYNRIMVNVTQGTMKRLRVQLFERMESLPISFFDTHAHGDIMSVYTNDVDTLRQVISQSMPQLINSSITFISTLIAMIVLDIPLTVLSVVMVLIMIKATSSLGAKSGRYFMKQQQDLGKVNGYIEEMMSGQKVVKVFCHEEKAYDDFCKLNRSLQDSAYKANMIANITMPVNANLGNISYVLCAVLGGVLAVNGWSGLTIGTLVAFLTLNKSFTMPVTQISQQINAIVMAAAGADRVFTMTDEKPEEDEGYVELVNAKKDADGNLTETEERTGLWAWRHRHETGEITYRELTGEVEFENVDFGYNPDKIVLHDINMYAKPGQKIAFVGSTGAGKTTITNLINRFYDIQDGKIRYDNINIGKIRKPDLRRSLGIVLQDTHLFTGTVMDNIRYGKLDAMDEECIKAAKLANAHDFIKRLPDGYNTILTGDGSNLSQGQRQLLAIARAAVADPPALILDEATSSIDTRTEAMVSRGMDALMEGRTSFVIAHRLSTVKDADCIMVMEQGRIIERGTHDQLIDMKGRYYQLYTGKKAVAGQA
ncbi:ABC transporter ATP-binding protein [Coprococcus sp. OM06-34AC]|jgi:ATP-binding cassette subfamily B multidrug efflux pump|nr:MULTISPECIES: ABC transporter ATP-binding protein [unclassified Coprococcus]RGD39593.1 ABC transporter ATP-binding protein [Coprococcus sp. AM14-16]RGI36231.1 ABC transporter ATP-binding protein [Coprococcus sp. OM06-34AC]RGI43522.1 ABC transporter ATP-binding protein [Coprococcus sp. OM06-25]RHU49008.1 ABC transporter ATP-binding protein [Coprococcus sp. TF11-13]